jgi:hypothetical protein
LKLCTRNPVTSVAPASDAPALDSTDPDSRRHPTQALAPAKLDPTVHARQSAAWLAPVALRYVPAAHSAHTALDCAPVAVEYRPAEQSVQTLTPLPVKYLPAAQEAQEVSEPAVENVPAGQSWQAVSRPSRKNLPAPQHTLVPLGSQCPFWPAAQLEMVHVVSASYVLTALPTSNFFSTGAAALVLYEVPTGVVRMIPAPVSTSALYVFDGRITTKLNTPALTPSTLNGLDRLTVRLPQDADAYGLEVAATADTVAEAVWE